MVRLVWLAAASVVFGATALGQIASPSPVTGRSSSAIPLSETFTPNSVFPPSPAPKTVAPPAPLQDPEAIPDAPAKPEWSLLPLRLPKPWSGGADFGLNGASGNSQVFNFRGGYNVRRKTDDNVLTSDFLYVYSVQNA